MRLRFLPPNTTSILQPLDAEVIAAIERRYRKKHVMPSLALVEQNATDIYKVDQLTAMQWIDEIWTKLDPSIVYNCWTKTGLIGNSDSSIPLDPDQFSIQNYLLSNLSVQFHDDIYKFLSPSGEDDDLVPI